MAQGLAPDVVVRILAAALLPVWIAAGPGPGASHSAPWRITIAPPEEPGEPLLVSGIVYASDGATPLPGITLDLHHTDARGYYSRGWIKPRLRGRLTTDSLGRYEFRTSKPAPYPGRRNPAHIHVRASGAGVPEQYPDDFWFEGDPFLSEDAISRAKAQGSFSPICRLTRDAAGVLHCRRDIRVQTASAAR